MKDFNEIHQHLQAIDEIDQRRQSGGVERRRAVGIMACHIADELVAGRPVPVFDKAESVTRIDGMLPVLANELVSQHDMAIAHRTHLAERLEADGGENGAKAAGILRGMNEAAEPSKEDEMPTSGDLWPPRPSFQIHFIKTHGEGGGGCGVPVAGSGAGGGGGSCRSDPKRLKGRAWVEEAKRRRDAGMPLGDIIREAGRDADLEAAELRGFYQGRSKAWTIVMNRLAMMPGLHEDGQAVLRAVSESIALMQKEG